MAFLPSYDAFVSQSQGGLKFCEGTVFFLKVIFQFPYFGLKGLYELALLLKSSLMVSLPTLLFGLPALCFKLCLLLLFCHMPLLLLCDETLHSLTYLLLLSDALGFALVFLLSLTLPLLLSKVLDFKALLGYLGSTRYLLFCVEKLRVLTLPLFPTDRFFCFGYIIFLVPVINVVSMAVPLCRSSLRLSFSFWRFILGNEHGGKFVIAPPVKKVSFAWPRPGRLLEKESNDLCLSHVTELLCPSSVHGPVAHAGLAADDQPIDAAKVEVGQWPQQRFGGNEAGAGRDFPQDVRSPDMLVIFNRCAEPDIGVSAPPVWREMIRDSQDPLRQNLKAKIRAPSHNLPSLRPPGISILVEPVRQTAREDQGRSA